MPKGDMSNYKLGIIRNGKFQVIQPNTSKITLAKQEESERRIKFETAAEMTSCFFWDSLTEQQKEEIRKLRPEKWINLCEKAYGLCLLNKEIENAKQSTEKMKLVSESTGSICIDTFEMKYVEGNNDTI